MHFKCIDPSGLKALRMTAGITRSRYHMQQGPEEPFMGMRCSLGIYNARNPEMFPSCLRWHASVLLLLQCAFASDWRIPEAQLADKIAAITGPGVIALNPDNRSSISSADIDSIRHRLVSDLGEL